MLFQPKRRDKDQKIDFLLSSYCEVISSSTVLPLRLNKETLSGEHNEEILH